MQKLITCASLVLFATSTVVMASPDKDTLLTAEKNAWQNIKDKKWDDFKKILSSDFRSVNSDGIHNLDKEMTGVKTLDLKSYTLGDIDVVFIDKDAAMLSYSVTVEGTEGGKEAPAKMNAASIW